MPKTKSKVYTRGLVHYDRIAGLTKAVIGKRRRLTTSITLSADDLSALGDYIAAGMVMLRISKPHRAVSKLKAAMSRVSLPIARGL